MVAPSTALAADSYVPIVKAKRAELDALRETSHSRLLPLLDVREPAKTVAALTKSWPHTADAIWLHCHNVEDEDAPVFAATVDNVFQSLRGSVAAVPVVTSAEEPTLLAAVAAIASADGRGAVLRVDVEDVLDTSIDVEADIDATLDGLGLSASDIDLVLDGGALESSPTVAAAAASQAMARLPYLSDWRNVVVAFGTFPEQVGSLVAKGSVAAFPRTDAAAWATVNASSPRVIVFGDYALGSASLAESPGFSPIPNIKYASGPHWYIHRANRKTQPSPQYIQLAKDVVAASYFEGAGASPGDARINAVATGASGPGNATTHLQAASARHFHVVLTRLATLGVP